MNLLYSTSTSSTEAIVKLIAQFSLEPLVIADTESELVAMARLHRPKVILIFMPGRAGSAVDIQDYIRAFLPHARVRILPAMRGTEDLLPAWKKVVVQALRFKAKQAQRQDKGRP